MNLKIQNSSQNLTSNQDWSNPNPLCYRKGQLAISTRVYKQTRVSYKNPIFRTYFVLIEYIYVSVCMYINI